MSRIKKKGGTFTSFKAHPILRIVDRISGIQEEKIGAFTSFKVHPILQILDMISAIQKKGAGLSLRSRCIRFSASLTFLYSISKAISI
jgi:hypothetical protein